MTERNRIPIILGALLLAALLLVFFLRGGGPAPGSPDWCRAMMNKPQGEVTATEAETFATRCME